MSAPLTAKYFTGGISEWTCHRSGVRWYTPARVAEGDFYEFLGQTYPWYYAENRWDQVEALRMVQSLSLQPLVDVGCGAGHFVAQAAAAGLASYGTDINDAAIAEGRRNGLALYRPEEFARLGIRPKIATMLQIVEHVPDPVGFIREQLALLNPEFLVIATPNYQSFFRNSSDPLYWPPHHVTAWSPRGFRTLATAVGCRLISVQCEPLSQREYFTERAKEKHRVMPDDARRPPSPFTEGQREIPPRIVKKLMQSLRVPYFSYGRSVLGLFKCNSD